MRKGGTILVGATVCALAYLLVGCVGELVAIVPSTDDMNATMADMAQPQEMGDGKVHFFPDIQSDLDKLGCTAAGACHGGVQAPFFKPAPTSQTDKDNNYDNFVTESNQATPTMSTIIQKATGAVSHTGGPLLRTTDPAYQRWLDWIPGALK
jgi:hypothetical protein